eukprot:45233_1
MEGNIKQSKKYSILGWEVSWEIVGAYHSVSSRIIWIPYAPYTENSICFPALLNEMEDIQTASDIATQLLNSSDSRVAAAAKRIFSNALIEEQAYVNVAKTTHLEMEETGEKNTHYESSSASASSSLADIPLDVKEAASAIGMLVDANRMATPSPSNTSFSASMNTCIVGTNATTIKSTAPTAICQSSPALNPQASEPQMDTGEELLLNPQSSLASSIRKKPSNQAERLHRR